MLFNAHAKKDQIERPIKINDLLVQKVDWIKLLGSLSTKISPGLVI